MKSAIRAQALPLKAVPNQNQQETEKLLWIGKLSTPLQWTTLVTLSIIFITAMNAMGMPAGLLLGPMIAGIIVSAGGGKLYLAPLTFGLAQGVIGCMIANMLPMSICTEIANHWLVFLLGVVSVIVASLFLGWAMTRMRFMPGTTIVWGLCPGAATAMTVMAENNGADGQLVAMMQYIRVVMVAALASFVARLNSTGPAHVHNFGPLFGPIAWLPLAETIALIILGTVVARKTRFTSASLLFPFIVGILLVHLNVMTIELPRWLLVIGYSFVGWKIGLGFTRKLLSYAAQALPRIIACSLILIAMCGVLSAALVFGAGIDPLTAYLAMSPGGADSAAIIAASTKVDTSFVMGMQTLRFFSVMLVGPIMAKMVAERVAKHAGPEPSFAER